MMRLRLLKPEDISWWTYTIAIRLGGSSVTAPAELQVFERDRHGPFDTEAKERGRWEPVPVSGP